MPLSDEDRRRIEEEEFRREARARAKRQFDADGAPVVRTTPPSGQPPKPPAPPTTEAKKKATPATLTRGIASVIVLVASVGLFVSGNILAFLALVGIASFMLLASLTFKTK
jgi:hypothetical protein